MNKSSQLVKVLSQLTKGIQISDGCGYMFIDNNLIEALKAFNKLEDTNVEIFNHPISNNCFYQFPINKVSPKQLDLKLFNGTGDLKQLNNFLDLVVDFNQLAQFN